MKVAVIGANGQLGSDLLRAGLKYSNVELIPLTRKELDITVREQVYEVFKSIKPDFVINTAAFHKTDLCEIETSKAFKINTEGVKNLVETCTELNTALVHISTDYVFDGKKLKEKKPYVESDKPNPINIYGISKYAGELIVQNYLEKFYVVRVASLFGRRGASGKGGNFVYTILEKAKKGEELKVIDDIYMSPTYTYDASKEIWNLILNEKPYGIYHITNTGYCSWYEFAFKILEFANIKTRIKPVKHTEFKMKAKRPLWSPLNSEKYISMPHWENALHRFIQSIIDNL